MSEGILAIETVSGTACTLIKSGHSELIIQLPLFRVTEDIIGLADLFKLLFCFFISRITVRMIFSGQFPVCLLQILVCRAFAAAKDLIVVPLRAPSPSPPYCVA